MTNYGKACKVYGIDQNKQIKKAYEDDWVENAVPIKKVSESLKLFVCFLSLSIARSFFTTTQNLTVSLVR